MSGMPRFVYEEEHEMFRTSVRKFLETEAAPYHAQWEKDGHVDRQLWIKAGEQGFLSPTVGEEYGGVGADFRYNAIVDEEIGRSGLTGIGWGLHSDIAVPYIVRYGNEAQKEKYLPKCVTGEIITAIAMTEPGAGSDLQGIKTTAVKDGDDYILNGSKTFITNGQLSDLVIVVAKTDPAAGAKGTSLFLVETGTPGFTKGRNLEKVGMKAQDTSELFFQDVRISKEQLLGEEGMGFVYLMQDLPQLHARPRGIILLARDPHGTPVGCGMTHPLDDTSVEVKRVFVDPAARGTGLGKTLCLALIDQARADGYARVLLDTSRSLPAAGPLYLALGFAERGPYQPIPDSALPHLRFFEFTL